MKYLLKIIKNGKAELVHIPSDNPKIIQLEKGAQYQLLDEQQQPVESLKIVENEEGVKVYIDNEYTPSLILQNSTGFEPLVSANTISLSSDSVLATEIVGTTETTGGNTLWYIGGGLLAAGGIAALAGGGGSKKGGAQPKNPETTTKPKDDVVSETKKVEDTQPNTTPKENTVNSEQAQGTEEKPSVQHSDKQTEPKLSGEEENKAESSANNKDQEPSAQPQNQEEDGSAKNDEEQPTSQPEIHPILTFERITGDDVINAEEAKQPLTISGTVQHLQENDRLLLKIGEVSYPATVENGRFTAQVSGATLANHAVIRAEVLRGEKMLDPVGAEHSVKVQTELPATPIVRLNPIAEDNVINLAESRGEIVVSGTVENAKDGDEVVIACGCPHCAGTNWHEIKTAVQAGVFSVKFANGELLGDGFSIVSATVIRKDSAGNQSEGEATQEYRTDLSAPEPTISINPLEPVSRDAQTVELSGKIDYPFDVDSKSIQVTLVYQGQTFTAQVENKQWSYSLPVALSDEPQRLSVQVSVQDKAGNCGSAKAEDSLQFASADTTSPENPTQPTETVEPPQEENKPTPATIIITEVESNPSELVRLTGKVELTGLFAQYHNPLQVQSVVIKFNDKEYKVGINNQDQRFYLDIPFSDLANAKGKELTFENKGGVSLYYLEGEHIRYINVPKLEKTAYQFDENAYIANGVVKTDFSEVKSLIKGKVSELAKVGDTVNVEVGSTVLETKVKEDFSFSVDVDRTLLKNNPQIRATWQGKDSQDQITSATDTWKVPAEKPLSGNQVETFATANQDKPYFIKGLEFQDQNQGYLKKFAIGEGANITYAFHNQYYQAMSWTEPKRKIVREVLDLYERYANLKFTQITDNSGFDQGGTVSADIQFHHRPLTTAAGVASYGGHVSINTSHADLSTRSAFFTLMHEVGHSLGAKHTFEGNHRLPGYFEDHSGLSVLSYTGTKLDVDRWDLRLYDIAFMQYRYGVNPNTRTGNDTYTFKTFNPQTPDGNVLIWDGAGIDTFDASQENTGVTVDLTPGSWIYRGHKANRFVVTDLDELNSRLFFKGYDGNLIDDYKAFFYFFEKMTFSEGQAFIGYGTQIERLIGSAHNDILKGNVANNAIYGGNGDDQIWGHEGDDYLDGGKGSDTLYGGSGNDIFIVDNLGDKVIEYTTQDIDTVYASVNYTLSENVDNLILVGEALRGEGNNLDNRIEGNALANILIGGEGSDTFVFNSPLNGNVDKLLDFNPNQDKIELDKAVFSTLTTDNLGAQIAYNSENGALSYATDNNINNAVHFADLPSGLEMQPSWFVLA